MDLHVGGCSEDFLHIVSFDASVDRERYYAAMVLVGIENTVRRHRFDGACQNALDKQNDSLAVLQFANFC